jgi:hypothetical protein
MNWKLLTAWALAVWLNAQTQAQADPIPITNPGFEDPAVSTLNNGPITGWTITGNGAGVWNINNSPLGFWTVPAPEGNQIAYVSGNLPPFSSASISQVLSATLQDGTVYTLTGQVGHPIGFGSTAGTIYTVALLAGDNVLASLSDTGPEGSFTDFSLMFDSTGSPFVGQALQIQLSSNQPQTGFDAIGLDASPTGGGGGASANPEPGSLTLVEIASLVLVGYSWHRRKQVRESPIAADSVS